MESAQGKVAQTMGAGKIEGTVVRVEGTKVGILRGARLLDSQVAPRQLSDGFQCDRRTITSEEK